MSVHWFPGHMAKAKKLLVENVKLVDVVIELRDARIPESSYNPLLQEIIGAKPRLVILTKSDLASPQLTNAWLTHLRHSGVAEALALDLHSANIGRLLLPKLERIAAPHVPRNKQNGAALRPVRTMVMGIPNVGKSSLINALAKRAAAKTGAMPGVTRAKQWIRVEEGIELLDTPGMLWPKLEDPEGARKLAATGAVGQGGFDQLELASWLLVYLAANHPELLARYQITEFDLPGHELLSAVGRRRGCIVSGGAVDMSRAAEVVLAEFRTGKMGPVTLDAVPVAQAKNEI